MPRFGADPHKFFETVYEGDAPWDIGRAQRAIVQLIERFPLRDPVLDVGSGSGDLSIWIATQGHTVLGVDFVPAAVSLSRERARSLSPEVVGNVEFRVGDALNPAAFGRFGSIVDTGFYHLFEADQGARFAAQLAAALEPGGRYYLHAFAVDFPHPDVPRGVTEPELRQHFNAGDGWQTLALEPAEFESRVGTIPAICGCFERVR
jgi:cyclopropane fatty-acyl-phospholipid synthase-like methyltransferase